MMPIHISDVARLGRVDTPITMEKYGILSTFSHSYHQLQVELLERIQFLV